MDNSARIPFSPARCYINLGAIKRNFARLGPPRSLMPVIKSDAYGHGLLETARALAEAGAVRFAVGSAREGIALRERGFAQEIVLLMGCLTPEEWAASREFDLIPLAGSFADLEMAESAANGKLKICVKCDSGMSRLGFKPNEAGALAERLRRSPNLTPTMTASHFACADMPEEAGYTAWQSVIFHEFYRALKQSFPDIRPSLGNSAASLGQKEDDEEIFRPGLVLYGGNPFWRTSNAVAGDELEWAMSVSAPIAAIREISAGESVSYGRMFVAERPTRVAVVACGYSQGYPRILSGRAQTLVNGRRAAQIGRVCMGMFMIDVTGRPDVRVGDEAWIAGGPGDSPVTLQELADLAGTIPYELMCSFGAMNPRIYEDS